MECTSKLSKLNIKIMAKKEYVKLTSEGLHLVTVLNYSTIAEMNGFYGKEAFFTDGFNPDIQCLFQALGNLGAFARKIDLNNEIGYIIVSNFIMDNPDSSMSQSFRKDYQEKLNQNSSPFRRIKIITEDHLIWYIENRAKITEDSDLNNLIKRYKSANKITKQQELF
jgi:hypothetical protein